MNQYFRDIYATVVEGLPIILSIVVVITILLIFRASRGEPDDETTERNRKG